MKLKALIKRMDKDKKEYHDEEVEFVVCTKKDGKIIAMDLEGQATNLAKLLKTFKGATP